MTGAMDEGKAVPSSPLERFETRGTRGLLQAAYAEL